LIAFAVLWCGPANAAASDIDGFTEPYRTINVAAAESGIIFAVHVREGEAVHKGQVLATLDQELFLSSLEIARQGMEAKGQLNSAVAELRMRKTRLERLEALRPEGHASQEELDRAIAELEIAEAKVLATKEALIVKQLEYERAKLQIERRLIRSPIDGVITKTHKEEGEFVAPNEPVILTLVQLDPLLAIFSVPAELAAQLSLGQRVALGFPNSQEIANGTVDFLSPVTDAESGTVRVKVRILNEQGRYRSGERCTLKSWERTANRK
jgi:RND family efflux transporter MFP subunit